MALTRITGSKYLKDLSVTAIKLAVDSVETAKIVDLNVTTPKLADSAITDVKLADGAVTTPKIADSAVSTIKIANSAVTPVKVDATGDYTVNKLTTTSDVVVGGNFTVNGTTTTVNSTTLEVTDKNIVINNGGTTVSAEGSGISVEGDSNTVVGSLIFKDASATKFAVGSEGAEDDIVGRTATQTLLNKTYDIVGTDLVVGGTTYADIEAALRALNAIAGTLPETFELDEVSAAYNGASYTITVPDAVTILAVYASGIRLRSGAGNDYTVAGNVVTLAEPLLGNATVDFRKN